MKIGIDARLWNETGVGRYIRNMVKYLQIVDKKNEYVLFVRAADYENVKCQISNVKFQIKIADIRWHTIEEQVKFPKILRKENLDLVHFPYFSFPIFYQGKFVITIHDLILHHFPTGKASTLHPLFYRSKHVSYKFLLRYAAQHAEKIITVSNATKIEIIDHLKVPEEKIVVTYEGIDKKISNVKYQMSNVKVDNYFLYVGNAYPHKNLEQLTKAFELFKKKISNEVTLILVGKQDYFYKRLEEKIAKSNSKDSIVFLHDTSDDELGSLYKNAISLVLPSLMEGFGLPAIEAMSHNCLVLVSDIAVFHEVCQDAAIYFDPKNINSIAEKLRMVYNNNNNFTKQKEDGLKLVKDFSWKKMAEQTLQIYESCVSVR